MHPDDELPAGWLTQFRRGLLSGAGLFLLAVGLCAVPTFAVWLVPGADTTPASTPVKAGALLALSAAHGGIELNGTTVTLVPLLVTALLGWLILAQARRAESWSGLLGLALGYGIASGLVADWATLGTTRAPAMRSMLAAWIFVALVGGLARGWDASWPRLAERWRRVVRAAGVASCCYLLAGALLAAGALAGHFHEAVAMQRQLAPGAAGLPIALLGIAATPNATLAAVGYLTGPGFQLGPHTAVSAASVSHGQLPVFPLLAGVPHGRPATVFGLLVIAALALLAGWTTLRVLLRYDSWLPRLGDAVGTAVLTGLLLAVLSALGSGSVGDGSLRGIGPVWWEVGVASILATLFGAAIWLAVEVIRGAGAAEAGPASAPALRPVPASEPASEAESRDEAGEDEAPQSEPAGNRPPAPRSPARKPAGQPAARQAEPKPLRSRNVS